jgi:sodium/proline symporter
MSDAHRAITIISFSVYSLAIVALGLYSARFAKRSDEDFFLAGRSLGSWVAALSASASSESGWVTLGLVGWAFTEGVRAYWIIPGCLLGFLFNWFVLAGPLHDRSRALNAMTLPDFFSYHFKERKPWLRTTAVIVIFAAMLLYVAAQFAAAGKSFSASFADVSYQTGVVIGAVIVLIYTVIGGFRAVSWTDFLQGLLMAGTLVLFPIYLLLDGTGYGITFARLGDVNPELLDFFPDLAPMALIGFLFGSGALGINFGYPGQPHVLVRFMSLKSRKEAIIGGIVSAVWAACVYWGAVTVGLMARGMAAGGAVWARQMLDKPDIYGEVGLVLSAMHLLPGVLSGLVLAAVLAAICSTADSQLAVAGSAIANDIYARMIDKQKKRSHFILNRVSILALGLVAVLLVFDQEIRVYQYVLTYGWAILGASFGPQLVLALFWKRATYAGCLAGMLTGFLVSVLWPQIYTPAPGGVEIYNLPFAFMLALLVNLIVSRAGSSKREKISYAESGK